MITGRTALYARRRPAGRALPLARDAERGFRRGRDRRRLPRAAGRRRSGWRGAAGGARAGFQGLNVTVPHKQARRRALRRARGDGAAVRRRQHARRAPRAGEGANTDAPACLALLGPQASGAARARSSSARAARRGPAPGRCSPSGPRCGRGPAARGREGARATGSRRLSSGPRLRAAAWERLPPRPREADVVVNATSVGLGRAGRSRCPRPAPARAGGGRLRLRRHRRSRGPPAPPARARHRRAAPVRQGALAFTLWTGQPGAGGRHGRRPRAPGARMSLRYLTAGESHGPALVAIAEGFPAGLTVDFEAVNRRPRPPAEGLRPRRPAEDREGRGAVPRRAARRRDARHAHRARGLEQGPRELEGPRLALRSRRAEVHPGPARARRPRRRAQVRLRRRARRARARQRALHGGHWWRSARSRSSSSPGFGVAVSSRVVAIGRAGAAGGAPPTAEQLAAIRASDLEVDDEAVAAEWRALIDAEKERGGSIGGAFEVYGDRPPDRARQPRPPRSAPRRAPRRRALRHPRHPGRRGRRRHARGLRGRRLPRRHPLRSREGLLPRRRTAPAASRAGVTNGAPLVVRGYMKPIPTMTKGLPTVDLATREATTAKYERSDVCAVPAAAVVGEAVVAWQLAERAAREVRRRSGGRRPAGDRGVCRTHPLRRSPSPG